MVFTTKWLYNQILCDVMYSSYTQKIINWIEYESSNKPSSHDLARWNIWHCKEISDARWNAMYKHLIRENPELK